MKDPTQVTYLKPNGRLGVMTVNEEPSRTQQQYAEECDINNIMRKYSTTGEFTHLTSKQGRYADFSEIKDYRSMLHTVMEAESAFMALPADVRLRFKNDPHELLSFIQDTKNYDEALKLGLVNPRTPPEAAPIKNDESNDESKTAAVKKAKEVK